MENKNNQVERQENKYVLLEKPMFFNSKLNNQNLNTNDNNKINKEINIDHTKNSTKEKIISKTEFAPKTQSINNIEKSPKKQKQFRCFKEDPNETKWSSRYGRPGYVKSSKKDEDKIYFDEHFKNLEKKEAFDFNSLDKNGKAHIYLKNQEIFDENEEKLNSFKNIDFHPLVKNNIEKMKYDLMTPIQKAIIPYVLKYKDCLGCAQTGSGKTIAFLTPIISLLLKEGPPQEDSTYLNTNSKYNNSCSYPVCLIIVPTRELAEQIYIEARKLLYLTGIVVCKIYGGVPNDTQMRELRQGVDMVVGTPGRIMEFVDKKILNLNLIKFLVIDESDRMLDMGFKYQLEDIIYKNKQMPPKENRVNLMFSATIPKEVMEISYEFLKDECYLVTTNNTENINGYNANENVEQIIYYVEDEKKILKLHEILQQTKGSVLIFMEKKKSVDVLVDLLLCRNYNAIGIHGDKSQDQRQKTIKMFSSGEIPILVATDVASRGLDFPNISYVFNYDMPKNIEDYIHRIGRTGRVGNKGKAISFYNDNCKQIAKSLVNELRKNNQEIPDFLSEYDEFDYINYNNDYKYFDEEKEKSETNEDKYKNYKFKDIYNKKNYYKDYNHNNNRTEYYNYRGRGNNYRGYYKYKRNNDYNGYYQKGRKNDNNWGK